MFDTLNYDPQVRLYKRFINIYVITCLIFGGVCIWVPYLMVYGIKIEFMKVLTGVVTSVMALATAFLVTKGWNVLATLKPKHHRIKLENEDFNCLVRGGILTIEDAHFGQTFHIALSDIGFHNMERGLELAIKGVDIYKAHQRTQNRI